MKIEVFLFFISFVMCPFSWATTPNYSSGSSSIETILHDESSIADDHEFQENFELLMKLLGLSPDFVLKDDHVLFGDLGFTFERTRKTLIKSRLRSLSISHDITPTLHRQWQVLYRAIDYIYDHFRDEKKASDYVKKQFSQLVGNNKFKQLLSTPSLSQGIDELARTVCNFSHLKRNKGNSNIQIATQAQIIQQLAYETHEMDPENLTRFMYRFMKMSSMVRLPNNALNFALFDEIMLQISYTSRTQIHTVQAPSETAQELASDFSNLTPFLEDHVPQIERLRYKGLSLGPSTHSLTYYQTLMNTLKESFPSLLPLFESLHSEEGVTLDTHIINSMTQYDSQQAFFQLNDVDETHFRNTNLRRLMLTLIAFHELGTVLEPQGRNQFSTPIITHALSQLDFEKEEIELASLLVNSNFFEFAWAIPSPSEHSAFDELQFITKTFNRLSWNAGLTSLSLGGYFSLLSRLFMTVASVDLNTAPLFGKLKTGEIVFKKDDEVISRLMKLEDFVNNDHGVRKFSSIKSLEKIEQDLGPNTWLFLDIDDTLLARSSIASTFVPVEKNLLEFFERFKQTGTLSFALTSRIYDEYTTWQSLSSVGLFMDTLPIEEYQIRLSGVNFPQTTTTTYLDRFGINLENASIGYSKGIIFTGYLVSKADALIHFLERCREKGIPLPEKIVFADDLVDHLNSMEQSRSIFELMGIKEVKLYHFRHE